MEKLTPMVAAENMKQRYKPIVIQGRALTPTVVLHLARVAALLVQIQTPELPIGGPRPLTMRDKAPISLAMADTTGR